MSVCTPADTDTESGTVVVTFYGGKLNKLAVISNRLCYLHSSVTFVSVSRETWQSEFGCLMR